MGDFHSFSLPQWLDHIQRQHWRTIDLKLDRIASVWHRLGAWRPSLVITVAGTNGKGSSVAMLESALRHAGLCTGAYTSPHLVRYNERVRIDGKCASDEALISAFVQIESAREDIPLTYFEYGTLCAMLAFQSKKVDVALLETGMGGRLDAVNIVENDLALITSVGLDHQQWLGSDREEIGAEKAGVIKTNALVVCTDPRPPAAIERVAAERGALLLQAGRDYQVAADAASGSCTWHSSHPAITDIWRNLSNLPQPLPGWWQTQNLGGVVAALALVSERTAMTPDHMKSGLGDTRLPGRCQVIPGEPLTIIDVAHNADSAAGLAEFLEQNVVSGNTHAVFGLLRDKALETVLNDIRAKVNIWHLATLSGERGQDAVELDERLKANDPALETRTYPDPVAAFVGARSEAVVGDRIIVFGSFFVVGDILGLLENGGPA